RFSWRQFTRPLRAVCGRISQGLCRERLLHHPGRGSTYRRGNSVQTTAATSAVGSLSAGCICYRLRFEIEKDNLGFLFLFSFSFLMTTSLSPLLYSLPETRPVLDPGTLEMGPAIQCSSPP